VVSKQAFKKTDHTIFLALWQWAKRRHPHKPKRWIKDNYFQDINGRRWSFCAETVGKNGKPIKVELFQAASIAIKRHRKIKGEANPYDRQWEIYFEERLDLKMLDYLNGRRKLLNLWFGQEGRCVVCSERITKETGWNIHHLVRRTDGGKETMDNFVLLDPNCHRQVHSQGMEVSKPRSMKRASRKAQAV
jgi:RNA-directed DNA polymerase